jgi:hypothetical protein
LLINEPPNGLRYWRWGGHGFCLGAEKTRSPKNTENAQTPQRPVHAVLGALIERKTLSLQEDLTTNLTRLLYASLTNTPDKHHD